MDIKPGVSLLGIKPEMVIGVICCESVYNAYGFDMTITSVTDGKHGRGSLHFSGNAVDLRTRDLPPENLEAVHRSLKKALGDEFDVVLEKDHFHVEYQPKT